MSSTTKKPIIDPKSKEEVANMLGTDDLYRALDNEMRHEKEISNIKKRRIAKEINEQGEELLYEIEEKNRKKEEQRVSMMEFIDKKSKEKFIKLEELNKLDFDEVKKIYEKVLEWKKPWWQQFINIFRK